MYGWEIGVRGGDIVMSSSKDFSTYDEAKEDLIENINGTFMLIREKGVDYNYTIFDESRLLDNRFSIDKSVSI